MNYIFVFINLICDMFSKCLIFKVNNGIELLIEVAAIRRSANSINLFWFFS